MKKLVKFFKDVVLDFVNRVYLKALDILALVLIKTTVKAAKARF